MKTLFEKLTTLINEHGIKQVLIALEDIALIQASYEHLRGNKKKAKGWQYINKQIRKIKSK